MPKPNKMQIEMDNRLKLSSLMYINEYQRLLTSEYEGYLTVVTVAQVSKIQYQYFDKTFQKLEEKVGFLGEAVLCFLGNEGYVKSLNDAKIVKIPNLRKELVSTICNYSGSSEFQDHLYDLVVKTDKLVSEMKVISGKLSVRFGELEGFMKSGTDNGTLSDILTKVTNIEQTYSTLDQEYLETVILEKKIKVDQFPRLYSLEKQLKCQHLANVTEVKEWFCEIKSDIAQTKSEIELCTDLASSMQSTMFLNSREMKMDLSSLKTDFEEAQSAISQKIENINKLITHKMGENSARVLELEEILRHKEKELSSVEERLSLVTKEREDLQKLTENLREECIVRRLSNETHKATNKDLLEEVETAGVKMEKLIEENTKMNAILDTPLVAPRATKVRCDAAIREARASSARGGSSLVEEVESLRRELIVKAKQLSKTKKEAKTLSSKIERAKTICSSATRAGVYTILSVTLLLSQIQDALAQNCNFESSSLAIQNDACDDSGKCEVFWAGSGIMKPGEAKCFKLGNDSYKIMADVVEFPMFRREGVSCMPLVEGECYTLKKNVFEENSGIAVFPNKNSGTGTEGGCGGDSTQICSRVRVSEGETEVCEPIGYYNGNLVQNYAIAAHVKRCGNDMCGTKSARTFSSYFCLNAIHRYKVYETYSGPSEVKMLLEVNGEVVESSSEFSAVGLSSDVNPYDGITLILGESNFFRYNKIQVGDTTDVCAVTLDEDGTAIVSKNAWRTDGACKGSSATKITTYWDTYSRKEIGLSIPNTDTMSKKTLEVDRVYGPAISNIVLNFQVKSTEMYSGSYTNCDPNKDYYTIINECPDPDYLVLVSDCLVAVRSVNCLVNYLNMSDGVVVYSVVNYNNVSNCMLEMKGLDTLKSVEESFPAKSCVNNPMKPYTPSVSSDGGSFSLFGLGKLFSGLLMGLFILIGMVFLFFILKCIFCKFLCGGPSEKEEIVRVKQRVVSENPHMVDGEVYSNILDK